jgi:UMF1 family MFS transporter
MMIRFKESKNQKQESSASIIDKWFVPLSKRKFVLFFTTSMAAPMIIAFFFFNDASLTVTNNFWIFLQKVFGIADNIKSILLILIIIMAAIGGLISWWIGDRYGQRKTLKGIFIWWIVCLSLLTIISNIIVFYIVTIATGLLVGAAWTVSRSYLTTLLKKDELWYGFSFYALSERFATFLWPLTWWGIVWYYGQSVLWYRYAMAFMIVFMIIALLILVCKKPKKTRTKFLS